MLEIKHKTANWVWWKMFERSIFPYNTYQVIEGGNEYAILIELGIGLNIFHSKPMRLPNLWH